MKRKLFQDVDVLSTNGTGDSPGHFTSQHVEGAGPCVPNRDPWQKLFSKEKENGMEIPIQHVRGTATG